MSKKCSDILQYIFISLAIAGAWIGYLYINHVSVINSSGFLWLLSIAIITFASVIIGLWLSTILHEAGHMLGGLITGYKLIFFNVFFITITKIDDKFKVCKRGIKGASGMCLMSPPDMKNGTFPHKLFISGGIIINLILSFICFYLFIYFAGVFDNWSRIFLIIGIVNSFFGILNSIPQRTVGISDGYVFYNLNKQENADMRQGCWSYMRILGLDAKGVRASDLPKYLFDWVDDENINDMFTFQTACKKYDYLLDNHYLDESRVLMQNLCKKIHNSIADVQKMSCYGELLFHETINECRQDEVNQLYTKKLKDYIKATLLETSTIRLMYAYSIFFSKDCEKAKEYLNLFSKVCSTTLWSGTAKCEKGLISLIDKIAENKKMEVYIE